MKNLVFELQCIEPDDIRDEKSFTKGLSYSNKLWKGTENSLIEKNKSGILSLESKELDILIKIAPIDTTKMITDYVEVAFIMTVNSSSIEELEDFRLRLLHQLKAKLSFKHLRVLRDDVSTHIANELYPKINEVENRLRRYLIKFFTQRVGVEWWDVTANKKMSDKVKIRTKDRKDEFVNYIKTDIEYADFDDLGQLIYRQSSGFPEPEKALEQILAIDKLEDLVSFQDELQGNYIKYFKENFRNKNFEKLWIELFKIRNKVAHHGTFYKNEFDRGLELHKELMEIIQLAEDKIDQLVLNIEDIKAFYQKSVNAVAESAKNVTEKSAEIKSDNNIKIVGKIDLAEDNRKSYNGYEIITEERLLEELAVAEVIYQNYVGLKGFVTEHLADLNFSIGFSYSLINILAEKGDIILYDKPSYDGSYSIKAIKSNIKKENVENNER